MGRAARRKSDLPPSPAAPARRAAAPSAGMPPWLGAALGPLLIVAVVWAVYANSFAIPFIFDDYFEIEANPTVQELQPIGSYLTRSRGLTALTFALNVRQSGADVWGFHFVNVAIHLANALLVYLLVLRTLRLPFFAGRYAPRARVLATLVALVFAVHPLQTMAASYIVQRAESLASFFYLVTLLCATSALAGGDLARRAGLVAVAGLAAVLGVVSKEIVATVPVAVALYWFCFLSGERRIPWTRWLLLLALLALPVGYGLLLARDYLMPAMQDADPLAGPRSWLFIPTAGFSVEGIGSWQYLITQFGVIVWYLRLFALPTGQVFDYGWPFADTIWRADVLLPAGLLLAVLGVAVATYRRYRLATFCLGWMFLTLAPSSSIIPLRDAAFEHRMYLPIIGLAWLVVCGGHDLLGWLARRQGRPAAGWWRIGAAVAGVWIALLGLTTIGRNAVLADPFALAEDNAAKAPGHWRAQYQLGEALLKRQRPDEAMTAFEEAIRLNPNQGSARVTLGSLYLQRRRYDDAERVLEPATFLMEESVVAAAAQNLAVVYQARGDLDRAEELLLRAIDLKPQWSSAQRQLAGVYHRKEFWLPAARYYNDAVKLNPKLRAQVGPQAAVANYEAARQLSNEGRTEAALTLLSQALEYDPGMTRARRYYAYVLSRAGDFPAAIAALDRADREQGADAWSSESRARAAQGLLFYPPPN